MNIFHLANILKKYSIRYLQQIKININKINTKEQIVKYAEYIINNNFNKSTEYVAITGKNISGNLKTKLIAFYLPQYYENEVNNKYFGKGFMEWYNVTKCIPQYTGHYQPHLPIDTGFYDLSHDDIMYRQIELAKKYGIYGFCFYYYWFSGDRLLEKPLDNFLNNKKLNIPFCLFWANESWTNLWGNGERTIIKKQELLEGDAEKFSEEIIQYFKDGRYIKIGNKPLFIIYKSQLFPKKLFDNFIEKLRLKVKNAGFDDLYLLITDASYGNINPDDLDINGVVEFTHENIVNTSVDELFNLKNKFVNPYFKGRVIDIKKVLNHGKHLKFIAKKTFRCVCAGWDNSPRKAYKGALIFEMKPDDFKIWLKDSITWTRNNLNTDEQIVFIDSWNEWAEGAHLEPDQYYGYAYLQATKDVLEKIDA